ncbi:MAG: tRNA pseudouridine(38-40) synthase TruA [Fusobacteriaceae bacterium]
MKNYMFITQYDGSRYKGWQRLPDIIEKSIQGKIEIVLSKLLNEEIKIIGSGRTDAGVHALMQVCNFKTNYEIQDNFIMELNRYLPEDIKIIKFKKVDDRFHARYNAINKIYMYRIDNSPYGNPFLRKFSYFIEEKLDLLKMQEVANIFLGVHDFTSFSKNNGKKKNCVRHIKSITIKEENNIIEIYFEADGFLYNMVRMLTGAIISVGLNLCEVKEVSLLLKETSREKYRFVVPPQGLFLVQVDY